MGGGRGGGGGGGGDDVALPGVAWRRSACSAVRG